MATEEEKKVEQTQPQMPKQLEYANQVINSMTDNKGYNPIQTIINTAPKTHEEAKFRKAQIDRGGYTPPTPMQMSGLTEEQVKANEEAQRQAKADADAKAQAEKEANEEKWSKRWAAIGDGISSIANLVAVGHGAPNMYDPSNSLHSKIKGEYDRIHALKAADAQARRKEQMDLLLKQYELDARAAEAEANRNLSMWRTETEEAGRNQRAKDKQESDQKIADQRNETTLKAATIRGRSGGGGGSSSNGKYYYNGVAYKSESERNQKILRDAKKYGVDTKDEYGDKRDWDDLAVELEDLIAQGEPDTQPVAGNFVTRWGNMFGGNSTSVPKSTSSKASTPTKKDNAAVTP